MPGRVPESYTCRVWNDISEAPRALKGSEKIWNRAKARNVRRLTWLPRQGQLTQKEEWVCLNLRAKTRYSCSSLHPQYWRNQSEMQLLPQGNHSHVCRYHHIGGYYMSNKWNQLSHGKTMDTFLPLTPFLLSCSFLSPPPAWRGWTQRWEERGVFQNQTS